MDLKRELSALIINGVGLVFGDHAGKKKKKDILTSLTEIEVFGETESLNR